MMGYTEFLCYKKWEIVFIFAHSKKEDTKTSKQVKQLLLSRIKELNI